MVLVRTTFCLFVVCSEETLWANILGGRWRVQGSRCRQRRDQERTQGGSLTLARHWHGYVRTEAAFCPLRQKYRGTAVALRAVSRPGHGSSLLYTALRVRPRNGTWGWREAKILSNFSQTHGWSKTENPAAWALMGEAIQSKPSK